MPYTTGNGYHIRDKSLPIIAVAGVSRRTKKIALDRDDDDEDDGGETSLGLRTAGGEEKFAGQGRDVFFFFFFILIKILSIQDSCITGSGRSHA